MNTKTIFDFLNDLSKNNSLEWMRNNKKYYEEAKLDCEILIQEIINGIIPFDNSVKNLLPRDLMFRLNKDTRFSNDKSPYNPSFRAHISKQGKLPVPVGYYLSIKPNNIFIGGGLFAAVFTEATKSIRDYIVKNENKFIEIIEAKGFKNKFVVDGEKLKNVPKEYDKEHKLAEYIKYKSWFIEYKVKDNVFLKGNDFIRISVEAFRYMKPFNDFINKALKDFEMPERKQ
jgi:uncharacterized protein (TIGR02453 family)